MHEFEYRVEHHDDRTEIHRECGFEGRHVSMHEEEEHHEHENEEGEIERESNRHSYEYQGWWDHSDETWYSVNWWTSMHDMQADGSYFERNYGRSGEWSHEGRGHRRETEVQYRGDKVVEQNERTGWFDHRDEHHGDEDEHSDSDDEHDNDLDEVYGHEHWFDKHDETNCQGNWHVDHDITNNGWCE